MCAVVAAGRKPGISRLHVCVDCRVDPSGSMIVMGEVASFLFRTGAPSTMKWLVAPESLMAEVGSRRDGRGTGSVESAVCVGGGKTSVSSPESSSKPDRRAK